MVERDKKKVKKDFTKRNRGIWKLDLFDFIKHTSVLILILLTTGVFKNIDQLNHIYDSSVCEHKVDLSYIKITKSKMKSYSLYISEVNKPVYNNKVKEEKKPIMIASTKKKKNNNKIVVANRSSDNRQRGAFKSLLPKNKITLKNSPELKLVRQSQVDDLGFMRIGDSYLVALGSYYCGKSVGCKVLVTMENGNTFTAIKADNKADRHTDSTNRFHLTDGSEIEFVVDMVVLRRNNPDVPKMGNASYSKDGKFAGKIKSIVVIE